MDFLSSDFLSFEAQSRLAFISLVDPDLANKTLDFCLNNPEFLEYLHLAAATKKFTLSQNFDTINNALIWYVCHTGVRNSYGDELWARIKSNIKSENIKALKMPETKRTTILEILKLPNLTKREEIDSLNIKGVGHGAKAFIVKQFFGDMESVDYTDTYFLKGMQILYKLKDRPTVTQAKKRAESWIGANKAIGSSFCFQLAHYAK